MEREQYLQIRNTPLHVVGDGMGPFERARAQAGMRQAMALGHLALAATKKIGNAFNIVASSIGSGIASYKRFAKHGNAAHYE